ncbi:hypothetical protein [Actinomadura fibrosa]|uniref:Uncharacterized protein n=1 Tax=Actinomadura fibrosa TaxID=111802 RepID=A0ABW2XTA9_9ACTN|nr:hypothetical protein [Actinomadura fibrosa]
MLAPDPAEAVRLAGGWLFDRVSAGWDVTVLTAGGAGTRPLRILGARAARLETVLACPLRIPRPRALAVHEGLYRSDARVRRLVLDALGGGTAEVRLWGGDCATDLDDAAGPVCHRPSRAARAFKAQALAAAALPDDAWQGVETFRHCDLLLHREPG